MLSLLLRIFASLNKSDGFEYHRSFLVGCSCSLLYTHTWSACSSTPVYQHISRPLSDRASVEGPDCKYSIVYLATRQGEILHRSFSHHTVLSCAISLYCTNFGAILSLYPYSSLKIDDS